MSFNAFGSTFRITTFGESHGPAIGVVLDGVRPGIELDVAEIQAELDRRAPGRTRFATPRREPDRVQVLSGVFEGKTTGAPVCLVVYNREADPSAYRHLRDLFRPGHADLTYLRKYGIRDYRGGGRASGRETVARVAAGAVAKKLLAAEGVTVVGYVKEIAGIPVSTVDESRLGSSPLRCPDPQAEERMAAAIDAARASGDSVGGVVEVVARGVPAGWGDPVFAKLDAQLAAALMSIGAVRGVELGDGFALARMRGSEANDPIGPGGFESNHQGGVLGGISSGAEILVRVAVKPTASIALPQRTIGVDGAPTTVSVRGRHDPCICPRLVPVAEAMVALVLVDAMLRQHAVEGRDEEQRELAASIDRLDRAIVELVAERRALASKLRPRPDGADAAAARSGVAGAVGLTGRAAEALYAVLDGEERST